MVANDPITTGASYCYTSSLAPTPLDSSYPIPTLWQTPDGHMYQLLDNTDSAAVWVQIPLTNECKVSATLSSLNGKNTGSTKVFTPSVGNFFTTGVSFSLTSVSGLVVAPTVTVGTNASSYDDILPVSALTLLTTVNNYLYIPITTQSKMASSGTDIFVKVTIGAIATTYTLSVSLSGFYA